MSRMFIDLKFGEVLTIGTTQVRLEKKAGQLARLSVIADDATPITPPKRRNCAETTRMSAVLDQQERTHG